MRDTKGRFTPAAKCPAYELNEDLQAAVAEKQQQDEKQFAELVNRGTPTVAVRTGADGGMNPTFRAAIASYNVDSDGVVRAPVVAAAGTIPANIRLPGERPPEQPTGSLAIFEPAVPRSSGQVASADSSGGWFGGLFSSSGRQVGHQQHGRPRLARRRFAVAQTPRKDAKPKAKPGDDQGRCQAQAEAGDDADRGRPAEAEAADAGSQRRSAGACIRQPMPACCVARSRRCRPAVSKTASAPGS